MSKSVQKNLRENKKKNVIVASEYYYKLHIPTIKFKSKLILPKT